VCLPWTTWFGLHGANQRYRHQWPCQVHDRICSLCKRCLVRAVGVHSGLERCSENPCSGKEG
jgi:hypothetical protein